MWVSPKHVPDASLLGEPHGVGMTVVEVTGGVQDIQVATLHALALKQIVYGTSGLRAHHSTFRSSRRWAHGSPVPSYTAALVGLGRVADHTRLWE